MAQIVCLFHIPLPTLGYGPTSVVSGGLLVDGLAQLTDWLSDNMQHYHRKGLSLSAFWHFALTS